MTMERSGLWPVENACRRLEIRPVSEDLPLARWRELTLPLDHTDCAASASRAQFSRTCSEAFGHIPITTASAGLA